MLQVLGRIPIKFVMTVVVCLIIVALITAGLRAVGFW